MNIYDFEVDAMKDLLAKRKTRELSIEERITWCIAKIGYFEKMSFLSVGDEQDNYLGLARIYEAKIRKLERVYQRNTSGMDRVLDMIF